MPDKEGVEGKSTKSVVSKKQKQMMGEEGYDIARDMGRVRPSKDKKDATTMPVSDEVRKTQKVNKGPSALELVKKKYGKAVMNVGKKKANEELDLTKVAESFGGYIILEQEFSDKQKSDMRKLLNKNFGSQEKSKETAAKLIKDTAKKDVEKVQGGRTVKKKINPNVSKGSGEGVIGKKDEKIVKPTTTTGGKEDMFGRKRITKKMSKAEADEVSKEIDAKSDPKRDARSDARFAERQFRKGFKQSGVSGDFSPTMPTQLRKVRQAQRDARAKKLGTPDPFSVDTSTAAADVAKQLGTAPVAGGRPFMPRRVVSGRGDTRKVYQEPTGPGGSTLPIQKKRESIPKDSGALGDAPRVKKRFSQLSQDIKDLKRDVKVDKDIEQKISDVSKGTGNLSRGKNASNDPSF